MSTTRSHKLSTLCATIVLLTLVCFTTAVQSAEPANDTLNISETKGLDLKFINAELALTKANLEFVLEKNSKRKGSYSPIFIEELNLRIKLYEEWGRQLEAENPQFIPIDIQKAKGELKIARMKLDTDEKMRKLNRNSISEYQINRSRLAVEAAQAWLAKVSHPSFQDLSRYERTQWRFVILGKDLLEMRLERQR
jgi:hypothetical protein